MYFPVNFAKLLRAPFSQNTSGRLLQFELNSKSEYSETQTIKYSRNIFSFAQKTNTHFYKFIVNFAKPYN